MNPLEKVKQWIIHRWAYVLVFLPAVIEWMDNARPPTSPFELAKVAFLGAVVGTCLQLLYRDADRLKHMADTDELTGLFNRRRFNRDIQAETTRAKRLRVPLTLIYLDVDKFKSINDTHGHEAGDLILKKTARFLEKSVRHHLDRCYRIGGDEFAVLMTGATVDDAITAVTRRRAELPPGSVLEKHSVTFSVGAVELKAETPMGLIRKADRNMYAAKKGALEAEDAASRFTKI